MHLGLRRTVSDDTRPVEAAAVTLALLVGEDGDLGVGRQGHALEDLRRVGHGAAVVRGVPETVAESAFVGRLVSGTGRHGPVRSEARLTSQTCHGY